MPFLNGSFVRIAAGRRAQGAKRWIQSKELLVSYGRDAEARILRKSEGISARVTQKGVAGLVNARKIHGYSCHRHTLVALGLGADSSVWPNHQVSQGFGRSAVGSARAAAEWGA